MISDIDFIIQYKDEEKAINLFRKKQLRLSWVSKNKSVHLILSCLSLNTYPRLVHKNKIMAIENFTQSY